MIQAQAVPQSSRSNPRSALPEIISAGGVLIDEAGRVLLCHPTGSRWDNWRLPKGTVDSGEDLPKAALREVLEETGYEAEILCALKERGPVSLFLQR